MKLQVLNRSKSLVKNALVIAVGSASVQLITFLLLPFYTSHLSTKEFGFIDVISTYSLLLVPLFTLEIGLAAFRYLIDARTDEKAKTAIITNTVQASGLSTILLLFIYAATIHFIHFPYESLAMLAIATAILPATFTQFARGLDKLKIFALSSVIGGVVAVIMNIILVGPYHMGARGMLIASIVSNIVSGIYLFISLHLYRYIDFGSCSTTLQRELLKYSAPLIPNAVSWWVINAADRTIIAIFLGVASNGIYAIAYKFPTVFSTLFSYFGLSWTESASVHINSDDRDTYFSETMTATITFFGSLACVIIACMSFAFTVLIAKTYGNAYLYIPILIWASFFSATAALYGAIYIASKKTRQIAVTTIAAGVLNVVLSLVFIHSLGLYATAGATAVAYAGLTAYRHYDVKKHITISYPIRSFAMLTAFSIWTTGLFYYNHLLLNIVNAIVSIILALYLNRSIFTELKQNILVRLKPLSAKQEQEVSEEISF